MRGSRESTAVQTVAWMVSAVGYGLVWGEMKKCDNGLKKIALDEKPMTGMGF